jgi:hypothetical protein
MFIFKIKLNPNSNGFSAIRMNESHSKLEVQEFPSLCGSTWHNCWMSSNIGCYLINAKTNSNHCESQKKGREIGRKEVRKGERRKERKTPPQISKILLRCSATHATHIKNH